MIQCFKDSVFIRLIFEVGLDWRNVFFGHSKSFDVKNVKKRLVNMMLSRCISKRGSGCPVI